MAEAKKYSFEKLTPINNTDISVYESAIDFVFKENDVRNVAISGAYGAGKSSVLASYKAKHKEKVFLHLSLAHFQEQPSNEPEQPTNEPVKPVDANWASDKSTQQIKDSILEGKILNQLIHQIPAEKIPQTNFRVKKTTGTKTILRNTAAVCLFILSAFHIAFFDAWSATVILP